MNVERPGGLVLDVGKGERDDLGTPHRRGVAEQDDRGIATPDRGGSVNAGEDLADVVDPEWAGQAASRCSPHRKNDLDSAKPGTPSTTEERPLINARNVRQDQQQVL